MFELPVICGCPSSPSSHVVSCPWRTLPTRDVTIHLLCCLCAWMGGWVGGGCMRRSHAEAPSAIQPQARNQSASFTCVASIASSSHHCRPLALHTHTATLIATVAQTPRVALASDMAAPAAAAASSSSSVAAAAPTPAVPTAADPFPHLREYFTDSHAVAASLPADTPIVEESYTAGEVELMTQLRDAVAAMVKDPALMVMTPDDIPGGMHQHWTNYWPEGKDHPLFEDKLSAKDADPKGWPQHELIRFLRARDMNLKKATKVSKQSAMRTATSVERCASLGRRCAHPHPRA